MKIIERPYEPIVHTIYEGECYRCDCRFECEKDEIYRSMFDLWTQAFTKCPNCGHETRVFSHLIRTPIKVSPATSPYSTPASQDTPAPVQLQLPLPESPVKTEHT